MREGNLGPKTPLVQGGDDADERRLRGIHVSSVAVDASGQTQDISEAGLELRYQALSLASTPPPLSSLSSGPYTL